MKLRVYAVLDKAVEAFLSPLVFRTEAEALRSFQDAVMQEGTQFNRHKSDYSFCFIAMYDDNLGSFEGFAPKVVAEGATIAAYPDELAKPDAA